MNRTNPYFWENVPETVASSQFPEYMKNIDRNHPCLFITNKKQMIILTKEIVLLHKEYCKYIYNYYIDNTVDNKFSVLIDESLNESDLKLLHTIILASHYNYYIKLFLDSNESHIIEKYDLKTIIEEHVFLLDDKEEDKDEEENEGEDDYDDYDDDQYESDDDFLQLPGHNRQGFPLRGCEGDFD